MFKEDNGNIPNEKLHATLKSLMPDMDDKELTQMINYVDLDDNGEIDNGEFLSMMAVHLGLDENEEATAFKYLDNEMEGMVCFDDLKHVLENMADKLAEEDMINVLNELECDGSGKVSFKWFRKVFCF